jgi:hypothetical protein
VFVWELPELMSNMGMTERSKVNSGLEEVIQESHRRANGNGNSVREPRGPCRRPLVAESINPGECYGKSWSRNGSDISKSKATQSLGANAIVELRKGRGKDECARHWIKD